MTESQKQFPIAFLEAGTDDNQSYCSMRLTREENGWLKIDVVGWGVQGANLDAWKQGSTLELRVFVECLVGVDPASLVVEKEAYSHLVPPEQEVELREIQLWGLWKLAINKTH